jgi:acyl carrier protein
MARDLDAMRAWLIERISKALKVKGAMDPDAPLSKYGLQSIDAVILAMEIEEEVGVELPPTLLWEYNTANECAAYLRRRRRRPAAPDLRLRRHCGSDLVPALRVCPGTSRLNA